jgi:predicted nucleotidyltransferase
MPRKKSWARWWRGGYTLMIDPVVNPELALALASDALRQKGVPFALVGGLAVSMRSVPRFTKDVDLAIVVADDSRFEQLVGDLCAAGFRLIPVDLTGRDRLATVRLESRHGVVDLLGASSGIEREVVDRAEEIDVEGVGLVPVARVEELVALKVLSVTPRRPLDQSDLENLLRINPSIDLDRVRRLLGLITDRGYARNQDLPAKLDAVVEGVRGSESDP